MTEEESKHIYHLIWVMIFLVATKLILYIYHLLAVAVLRQLLVEKAKGWPCHQRVVWI